MSYGITIDGFRWLADGNQIMTFERKKDANNFIRHSTDNRIEYRYRVAKL